MDVLSFINSIDIREHLRETDYKFNSVEAAWLIYQCRTATVEEKHNAWREVIDTLPDCEIPVRTCCKPQKSLHNFLKEQIQAENNFINSFISADFGCYFEYSYSDDYPWCWCRGKEIFNSFEECYTYCITKRKNMPIKIVKRKITESKSAILELSSKHEVMGLCFEDNKELIGSASQIFDNLRFNFPTPFKEGDILCEYNRTGNERKLCRGPFVIEEITTHMIALGYYIDFEGVLHHVELSCYMNLEYYDGELAGTESNLSVLSKIIKSSINVLKITDLIEELFESKEMSQFLIKNENKLSNLDILEMICKAPIDIKRKAEILLTLSKKDDFYKDSFYCVLKAVMHIEVTIPKEEKETFRFDKEDIFTVKNLWNDEEWPKGYGEGEIQICSSFENVMQYIETDMLRDEWSWDDKDVLSWYAITKWTKSGDADYKEIIKFELIDNQVMYFTYKDETDNYFKPNCNLNLITPFKTGDILTVDCRPHKQLKNILILENCNTSDCCALQGMYYDEKKKLFCANAVKHGGLYQDFSSPAISPLYKIKKADSLKDEEKVFFDLQIYMNGDDEKGKKIWELSHKGITIEEMKKFLRENINE